MRLHGLRYSSCICIALLYYYTRGKWRDWSECRGCPMNSISKHNLCRNSCPARAPVTVKFHHFTAHGHNRTYSAADLNRALDYTKEHTRAFATIRPNADRYKSYLNYLWQSFYSFKMQNILWWFFAAFFAFGFCAFAACIILFFVPCFRVGSIDMRMSTHTHTSARKKSKSIATQWKMGNFATQYILIQRAIAFDKTAYSYAVSSFAHRQLEQNEMRFFAR